MTDVSDAELINGRYRLIRVLRSDGQLTVYEATDEHFGHPRVLKRLHLQTERAPEFERRFLDLVRRLRASMHRSIELVLGGGLDPLWGPFVVCAPTKGRSLQELLESDRHSVSLRLFEIAYRVADALAYAHSG